MGSENGTPSSITSAPPAASACMTGTVSAGLGSPAVTKGMRAARCAARTFAKAWAMRLIGSELQPGGLGDGVHVLVAATREVHQQDAVLAHGGGELDRMRERVARL